MALIQYCEGVFYPERMTGSYLSRCKLLSGDYFVVMNIYPRSKQILSFILIILGAVLLFFAPENAWVGVVLLITGLGIETIGLLLRYSKQRNKK